MMDAKMENILSPMNTKLKGKQARKEKIDDPDTERELLLLEKISDSIRFQWRGLVCLLSSSDRVVSLQPKREIAWSFVFSFHSMAFL